MNHPGEVLSSPGMRALLTEAGKDFDYIIVDLPPLGPVTDVRAATPLFDGFILVIEWGRTARLLVRTILKYPDELLYSKCIGVIFNKVRMNKINMYDDYDSASYYHDDYGKYFERET